MIHVLWSQAKLGLSAGIVLKAVEEYVGNFRTAFGPSCMLWKHHSILHHASTVSLLGFLPNTLALERKHKTVLRWGQDHDYDCRGVIIDVLSQHLYRLEHAPWLELSLGLVDPRTPSKKMKEYLRDCFGESDNQVSGKARFSKYDVCWEGDLVALKNDSGWEVVRIVFLACTSGTHFAAVQPFRCVEMSKWQSTWKKSGSPTLADIYKFVEVLIYRGGPDDVQVLHPLSLVQ
jgi:hypothetical protein